MAQRPAVVHQVNTLRAEVAGWRGAGNRIALVPTMGALHAGHIALVAAARASADRIVVSVFVNPAQFAPNEDFARYPRTLEADLDRLAGTGADLVYAPSPEEMYPPGFATHISVGGPAAGLESGSRPHFFGGVATVVAKLFLRVAPDIALFGEKDFQQLRVVQRMVRDLDLAIEVIGVPTVREPDGLALSSRNAYLSPQERAAAPALHRVLRDTAAMLVAGAPLPQALDEARAALAASGFVVDYIEARHGETLAALGPHEHAPIRLLAAARLGTTRLIDNIAVPETT